MTNTIREIEDWSAGYEDGLCEQAHPHLGEGYGPTYWEGYNVGVADCADLLSPQERDVRDRIVETALAPPGWRSV